MPATVKAPGQPLEPPQTASAEARTMSDLDEAATRVVCGAADPPSPDYAAITRHLVPALADHDHLPAVVAPGETQHFLLLAIPVPCVDEPAVYTIAFLRSSDPAVPPADPRSFGLFPLTCEDEAGVGGSRREQAAVGDQSILS